MSDISHWVKELNAIGIALSAERDPQRLMDLIVSKAMDLSGADAGTLYIRESARSEHADTLRFAIMRTRSLGIHRGGSSEAAIDLPPIPLQDRAGLSNRRLVVACAVLEKRTIRLSDAYASTDYDFSGTRRFDVQFGYRSRSFIAVPMQDHEGRVIGVLQVINKVCPTDGEICDFDDLDQQLLESLASQAAVAMSNQNLIRSQRELFDAFIQLIAHAIDQKSPYTGGHCRRVPELTMMLARAACRTTEGPLKDFQMSEEELYELEVAGWLHDCGKIAIPEYIIDKATKLETLYDRLETLETRLEVLRRDAQIAALQRRLGQALSAEELAANDPQLAARCDELDEIRDFLARINMGGESMAEADMQRVDALAREQWSLQGQQKPLLTENEQENLKIAKGTLLPSEREVINSHMQITIDMLESLPYPSYLRRVPEYAGGHHEKMDGSGFPRGLTREQMSIPARMMAIADIFEALTASDRPYKQAMPLSQALNILERMRQNQHIDPDLLDVFLNEGVHLEYAARYLDPSQIDLGQEQGG